ncbi:ATP-dependent RNA helicase HrpA [Pseudactinotalea sp. HY158]|uniref:ATP-dependent RNA helicase HrpA n=1 Tax=Pseudactinotalea sp. HY158 TaxID=2654547 RepID=UPI00129C8280|nr:ATP-dependent RNA helicase HrpA [Pseudactinotalea sp. HY158]QGH68218.1 ATP-dependent RNA helicase HrpA [Pseudactinotalea sp. HY158]
MSTSDHGTADQGPTRPGGSDGPRDQAGGAGRRGNRPRRGGRSRAGTRGVGGVDHRRSGHRPPSERVLAARRAALPTVTYPEDLPVSARRDDIAAAIKEHQVVIVAGETGSGKTTQLPKICLDLGYGIDGTIGHTQPRRLAARTVADRIAEELGGTLGDAVGYQVRFTDRLSEGTLVKLMTDGILLAEIQRDPLLRAYQVIIVDEAHERSLNIDFLLGYLRSLLPKRPDLKVIITSATIDSERFAEHFGAPGRPAPVIEVTGRTYPVELRYRPLVPDTDDESGTGEAGDEAGGGAGEQSWADDDLDQPSAICRAVDELMAAGPGDVLVFCSGEREIRDATEALADHLGPRYRRPGEARSSAHAASAVEVLPLYARLSAAEQHRVFEAHTARRVVLATNVAETSLTVPGIRYVVDPGTARISRYSTRTKVQRLPIEPISQASANQRSGRSGRVAPGICIRLYSRRDFDSRPEYTEPEILRTSLASVILQMTALGLGDIATFGFVDPPDSRAIRDGVQLLQELRALEEAAPHEPGPHRLTDVGRKLAQLPIDPRLGRMLVEAERLGCVREVMIIVSGLSVQDVRERPAEHQQAADEKHRRFADPTSDFLSMLALWDYLKEQQAALSGSAFRRLVKSEFLHYLRIREWQDVHAQLRQLAKPLGLTVHARGDATDPDRVHQALLAGLLSHIGSWDERRREFAGARGTRFVVFPGSHLAKKPPAWVMAAELVETSRLFARQVARIQPEWAEELGAHLVKRSYSEPYWSTKHGAAMAREKVLLYGVAIVADRPVPLARVDGALAREMFARHALVEGQWRSRHAFLDRNAELLAGAEDLAARTRRPEIVADPEALVEFYLARLPESATTARHFDSWWKKARRTDPDLLTFTPELLTPGAETLDTDAFPEQWHQGDLTLPLTYQFSPGQDADGVTVHIPIAVLPRVRPGGFDWLVPGMIEELTIATIRALPKRVRVQLVPAPDTARLIVAALPDARAAAEGAAPGAAGPSFAEAFAAAARRVRGVEVPVADIDPSKLPAHLRMTFRVHTERSGHRALLSEGPDLAALQHELARESGEAVRTAVRTALTEARRRAGKSDVPTPAELADPAGPSGDAADGNDPGGPAGTAEEGGDAPGPVTGPIEQAPLTAWPATAAGEPWGELPGVVSTRLGTVTGGAPGTVGTAGGAQVRGYPAIVHESAGTGPGQIALRILSEEAAQAPAHRDGVLHLLATTLALPTNRVTSRWSPAEALTLAGGPDRSTAALVSDLHIAAIRRLSAGADLAGVRTAAAFARRQQQLRDGLEDEIYAVARLVTAILTQARATEKTITATTSLALLDTLTDVKAQVAALLAPGFVASTPAERLPHLGRYLAAAEHRVRKAAQNPRADADKAWIVGELTEAWWAATQAATHGPSPDPGRREALAAVRWQLEELRVSFFAQQLGTVGTVSEKRIRRALAEA